MRLSSGVWWGNGTNMHCLGNVWKHNGTRSLQSFCANSIFARAIRCGFESSMNCIHSVLFIPFLYLETHGPFLLVLRWNQSAWILFIFVFRLSWGYICTYVKQLVPYRLLACLSDSRFLHTSCKRLSVCTHTVAFTREYSEFDSRSTQRLHWFFYY